MRPQLLVGGLLVGLMGASFLVLELPFVYFWGIPFLIGGSLMALASPFLSETHGPVKPPEGYKFCVYCSNQMPAEAERCQHCNGLQPREGR
ncbi:MAG: hypothetical protein HY247_03575 [archaeon]|nr:MAG: hypothetical protein HY247_03575 [archaeon]